MACASTKCKILSAISKLFDSLDLIGSVLTAAKILMHRPKMILFDRFPRYDF